MREEEAREGPPEVSSTRIDLAEAPVELHERAQQRTGCEKSDTMIALISPKRPQRRVEQ